MGALGTRWERRFQTWRASRPPGRRKKSTKRGFRGIMDACESFAGNPVWPEGCFCDENIVNNWVLARDHYRQFGAKSAPKRSPK